MDITHITQMSPSTERAWNEVKTHTTRTPAVTGRFDALLGNVFKLRDAGDDGIFTSSLLMKQAGWRHDNLLRPIRRYVAAHPQEKGVHLFRSGQHVNSAVFWLPALQRFIVWLLNSLKGHEADQQRRCAGFIDVYSYMSGLRKTREIEFCGPLIRTAWPECASLDALAWEYQPMSQLVLDFYHDDLSQTRIDVSKLAARCGYSEKHVRRKLQTSRVEYGETDDTDFLTVAADGTLSRKTAVFLLLSLPKLLRARLLAFNELYRRIAPVPVPCPAGLPEYISKVDFNDPKQAVQACLQLVERTRQQQQHHVQYKAETLQRIQDMQGAADVLAAELAGKNEELARLKTSLAQATAAGSIVRSPETDRMVYHSSKLRQDHGWCTINDVLAALLDKYDYDTLLAMVHTAMPASSRDVNKVLRNVVRFKIGQKKLRADGEPVLRPQIMIEQKAFVRRVHTSNSSTAGYRAKHGTDRDWRWQVFFTPVGARWLVDDFPAHVEEFLAARCPEHMAECELPGELVTT
jgi:hypothetical protein